MLWRLPAQPCPCSCSTPGWARWSGVRGPACAGARANAARAHPRGSGQAPRLYGGCGCGESSGLAVVLWYGAVLWPVASMFQHGDLVRRCRCDPPTTHPNGRTRLQQALAPRGPEAWEYPASSDPTPLPGSLRFEPGQPGGHLTPAGRTRAPARCAGRVVRRRPCGSVSRRGHKWGCSSRAWVWAGPWACRPPGAGWPAYTGSCHRGAAPWLRERTAGQAP